MFFFLVYYHCLTLTIFFPFIFKIQTIAGDHERRLVIFFFKDFGICVLTCGLMKGHVVQRIGVFLIVVTVSVVILVLIFPGPRALQEAACLPKIKV